MSDCPNCEGLRAEVERLTKDRDEARAANDGITEAADKLAARAAEAEIVASMEVTPKGYAALLAQAEAEAASLRAEVERLTKDRDYFKDSYSRKLADEAKALDAALALEKRLAEVEGQRDRLAEALRGFRCVNCGWVGALGAEVVWDCPTCRPVRAALASLDQQPPQAPAPSEEQLFKEGAEAMREQIAKHFQTKADEQKAQADAILKKFGGHWPVVDANGSESERYNRRRFSVQLNHVAAEVRALPLPEKPVSAPAQPPRFLTGMTVGPLSATSDNPIVAAPAQPKSQGSAYVEKLNARPWVKGCHSSNDGECFWEGCPQLRDGEPIKSGRHCPLYTRRDDE